MGKRHTSNPAGITIVRSECPYGNSQRWLGSFLAILCILNALRMILERFAQATGRLDSVTVPAIDTVMAAVFLSPLFSAAMSSDSPPEKIGFSLCSLAAVCTGLNSALSLFVSDMLLPGAALTLAASLSLIAAFLVFSICRDHIRDASTASAITAMILIVRAVCAGLTFLAADRILDGFTVPWVQMLSMGSLGTFFTGIAASVAAAAVFLFMRTDVPNAHYPERLEYQPFDEN